MSEIFFTPRNSPKPELDIDAPFLGIGRFVIYDETQVSAADLGVNFFLDEASLGKSRSQSLTELILELNPDVQGTWYPNEVSRLN